MFTARYSVDDPTTAMPRSKVIALLADIVFLPTWHFEFSSIHGSTLYVIVDFSAPNTNRQFAPDGYPVMTHPAALMEIDVADCTEDDDFYRRLLVEWGRTMMHEGAEALRLRSRNYASLFHPHIDDQRANWARVGGDPRAIRH